MQTSYTTAIAKAIKGLALCAARKARPLQLPQLSQILQLVITGGAGTDDVTITLTDRKTGQAYSVVATGSATEATLLANILAAVRANAKMNSLVSVADGGTAANVDIDFTARHPNREYSLASVGGPNGVADPGVVTELQAEGGSGLEFGQLVARGSADGTFQAMSATTTVRDIAGMLIRTDANHFHSLENDTADAVDACVRGKHYPIAEECEVWVEAGEAVTPASRCYVCVEANGSMAVGDWGDTPLGTAQVLTVTPIVNNANYGFEYTYRGADGVTRGPIAVTYMPTDGTTSVADACAGLEDAAADGAPTGITVSAGGTTAITLTAAAGTEITSARNIVWTLDTEIASTTTSLASADVDMLDVSSIARYTASAALGELVPVLLKLQP